MPQIKEVQIHKKLSITEKKLTSVTLLLLSNPMLYKANT